MAIPTRASEELLAAPLPELIRDLGLAVAAANRELGKATTEAGAVPMVYTIPQAEIEIAVAISISKEIASEIKGGVNLNAFSLNASYKSTFGFKEEASSRIKLTIQARPVDAEPANPNPNPNPNP